MIDVPIQIYSDSSVARSVARRRGFGGRLRHLQIRHLWLQSRREMKHWQHPDCDCRTCGNTKTVKLDVETNDNIVDEKMWTSGDISNSTT